MRVEGERVEGGSMKRDSIHKTLSLPFTKTNHI